jgi:hypothetical protein
MQINNYYLSPAALSPAEPQSGAEPIAPANPAAKVQGGASTHTLSPELRRLIRLAGEQPEVRPEVVQQTKERLAQGLYAAPASAEQTADAILKASE